MKTQLSDLKEILYTEQQVQEIVAELAARISRDYEGKNLLVIVLLKGSFVFAADLVRQLSVPCRVEFMSVSSYGDGSTSSGQVTIVQDVAASLEGRDVLVLEDIVDTGYTWYHLQKRLSERHPNSLQLCSLLDKPSRRETEVSVRYVGRQVADEFIVGYGMDFNQQYRDLPCVGVLKRELYEQ